MIPPLPPVPPDRPLISASFLQLLCPGLGLLPESHPRIDVTSRVPPAGCRGQALLPGHVHALAGPAEIVANDTPGIIAVCVRSRKRSQKDQQGQDCGTHLGSPGMTPSKRALGGRSQWQVWAFGSCGAHSSPARPGHVKSHPRKCSDQKAARQDLSNLRLTVLAP